MTKQTTEQFKVLHNGNEYDIKQFMRDHPGGVGTLENYRDRGIAGGMAKFNHSLSAYHLLNDFKVGAGNQPKSDSALANGSLHSNNNGTVNGNGYVKYSNKDGEDLKDSNLTGNVSLNGRIITNEESEKNAEEIRFLEELEGRIDWSKPVFSQLHKIEDHYELWTNSPVYRKLRLFENPILESLTYIHWYMVPIFWIPIILFIGATKYKELVYDADPDSEGYMSTLGYSLRLLGGFAIWSLLEYSLHRWVFHLDPGNSLTMKKLHFLIHGIHHKVPFDGLRQVFPPVPAAVLASILYVPVHFIFSNPLVMLTGGLIGYLTYDMIHYYVHHGSPTDGTYLYAMKRYHSNHHFINHDKAFGISSEFWDHIFKTPVILRKLDFSLRW